MSPYFRQGEGKLPEAESCCQASFWLDLVAPPRCALCNQLGAELCSGCLSHLRPQWRVGAVNNGENDEVMLVAWLGDYGLREWPQLVRQWKFHGRWRVTRPVLSRAGPLPSWAQGAWLVPVPQSRWRFAERGYNQAAVLSHQLGERYGCYTQLLLRERGRRRPIHFLSGVQRRQAARNLHLIRRTPPPSQRRVILVDDVLTTGSTLVGCRRVLHESGYEVVGSLVLARTPRPESRVASLAKVT